MPLLALQVFARFLALRQALDPALLPAYQKSERLKETDLGLLGRALAELVGHAGGGGGGQRAGGRRGRRGGGAGCAARGCMLGSAGRGRYLDVPGRGTQLQALSGVIICFDGLKP